MCSLDEWVTVLKSTVMMCQKKLTDDHSLSVSGGNTVAYMLIWLLCIAFLRDTDHTSEVRTTLYPIVDRVAKGYWELFRAKCHLLYILYESHGLICLSKYMSSKAQLRGNCFFLCPSIYHPCLWIMSFSRNLSIIVNV